MSTWPVTLPPYPVNNKFSLNIQDLTVNSSMETGSPKRRKRFTAGIVTMTLNYILTSTTWATLLKFYQDYPTTAFSFTRPDTNATVSARFTKPPTVTVDSNAYKVTVVLEVLP